ncbi:MAG: hypothetical protein AAFU85_20510 [Planctomycetota bacterium]
MRQQNPIGLSIAVAGWVIGGLVFRRISAAWPSDPSVRRWQFAVSVVAVTLPPCFMLGLLGVQYPHLIVLSEVLGLSVVLGVFASGTRRFRPESDVIEDVGEGEKNASVP